MGLVLRLRREVYYPALWLRPGELEALGDARILAMLDDAGAEALHDVGGWRGIVRSIEPRGWPVNLSLDEMTRQHVARVIAAHGGKRGESAKALGINTSTLWRWMEGKSGRRRNASEPVLK